MWGSSSCSSHLLRQPPLGLHRVGLPPALRRQCLHSCPPRWLATVSEEKKFTDVWFNGAFPKPVSGKTTLKSSNSKPISPLEGPQPARDSRGNGPKDERSLKLGRTVELLHERLPTLLASPLPQDILSPQITLNLFPSTHPHLPTVSGKIAYLAALWTAPVAWGRVPVVGKITLVILSERMVKTGMTALGYRNEKLIVRWRTCGKTLGRGMGALYRGIYGSGDQVDKITEFLGGDERDDEEFTGLFIFEFDEEGRIVTHTIEHVQEGGNMEKMTRVVNVTDWLIGMTKGKRKEEPEWALGYCENDQRDTQRRMQQHQRKNNEV